MRREEYGIKRCYLWPLLAKEAKEGISWVPTRMASSPAQRADERYSEVC